MRKNLFGLIKEEHLQFLRFAHSHEIDIDPKLRYVGIIFIIFAYFLLANSTIFFEKVCFVIPIFQIFFIQFLTMLIIYLCLLLPKGIKVFKPKEKKLVFLRAFIAVITYYAYFSSKIWSNIIDNSLLFSIDSLIIPVIMYFMFGVVLDKSSILGLIIGFIGIAFVNLFDFKMNNLGGIIGIGSGIGLAFMISITSYMVKRDSPLVIAFYESIIGVITSGIFLVLNGWQAVDAFNLVSIISQATFFSMALFLFLDGFYYTEIQIIGALGYTLTVFVIFLETLILGKVADINSLIGSILVCGGGVIVIFNSYKKDKKKHIRDHANPKT